MKGEGDWNQAQLIGWGMTCAPKASIENYGIWSNTKNKLSIK